MKLLTKKKQNKMMTDLGRLLSIQNDYILKEDEEEVIDLYRDLAFLIAGDDGVNDLLDAAEDAFAKRHPGFSFAASSSPNVEVRNNE